MTQDPRLQIIDNPQYVTKEITNSSYWKEKDNESNTDATFVVRQTNLGSDVFANALFTKGDVIMEMKGKVYTWNELPSDANDENNHYLQIGKELYIGPSGGIDDLVNHSCNPNSAVIMDGEKVSLIAIKDIKKGDQITFDYSVTAHEKIHDTWQMVCLCNSKNCRKIIRDFIFLSNEIKKEYIKLGIVPDYILKEIA